MRIVTCDDSRITALKLRSELANLGHEVVAHGFDGTEGVALCREHKPDVVIFDVLMRQMNGDKAAKLVHDEGTATHIIMATSQGQKPVHDFAESIGAKIIIKPYSQGQLKQLLEGL